MKETLCADGMGLTSGQVSGNTLQAYWLPSPPPLRSDTLRWHGGPGKRCRRSFINRRGGEVKKRWNLHGR